MVIIWRYEDKNNGTKKSSLESATEVCCRCLPSNGEILEEQLFDLRKIQVQALKLWAIQNNLIVLLETLPKLQERTNEHLVAFCEASKLWYKVTKPGRFGFIGDTEYSIDPITQLYVGRMILREALPSEYLTRLSLQNNCFGDSVCFEGVVVYDEAISLVISQPDISGTSSSLQEIREAMLPMGFKEIPNLHLGYSSSLSFCDMKRKIAVFDAHPANSITSEGTVLPIDFILQHMTPSMENVIKEEYVLK